MSTAVKTPADIRAELDAQGMTITEWARQHGLKEQTVKDLLLGRIKGRYGEAHRAAVMLGLKRGVVPPAQAAS